MDTAMLSVSEAAQRIAAGKLVAFPTETVYGLGADADQDAAVAQVFVTKGRPADHPLIVHVLNTEAARHYAAHWPGFAQRLVQAFWPGPLTLVLPLQPGAPVARAVTAGLPTIALRCPAHPAMRALHSAPATALMRAETRR